MAETNATEKKELNPVLCNYTLIEILHLSYLVRDSLEYCHKAINVTEENFIRRKEMSKNMLAEGNFIEKWLNNHPNDEVKKMYPQLVEFFNNIYENEGYVNHETRKVDAEKAADFIEMTIKNYQFVEDVLRAFYLEYKKTAGIVDPKVEKAILSSFDYYRVITNWLFFNQVIDNDNEYKKALKASGNKPSYEVNYNLNILKRLVGGYNFNKSQYKGDKLDIKQMMEDTLIAFKGLDGTLAKDKETAENKKLTNEELTELIKGAIEKAGNECITAIRIYEQIWKETYNGITEYMKENPLKQPENIKAEA